MKRNKKTAVITGVTGQDGAYLTSYLLSLNYKVIGVNRRTSLPTTNRLKLLINNKNLKIVSGDVTDLSSLQYIANEFKPDEWYHLAAQSHVQESWRTPISTCDITGMGTLNCLEAIRKFIPLCKFYFAGSSEQFGNTGGLLNENSTMSPESPYAAAKVFGYNITQVYRRSYDLFASSGILFNHESPLRGEKFVTRKITSELAKIKWGIKSHIRLGNIYSKRDWGFAKDYCVAMQKILQHDNPDDFVIATGKTHSVEEFLQIACNYFSLDVSKILVIDSDLVRPKDVDVLIGDSSKAKNTLNWNTEVSFEELVTKMCKYDYFMQSPHRDMHKIADNIMFD